MSSDAVRNITTPVAPTRSNAKTSNNAIQSRFVDSILRLECKKAKANLLRVTRRLRAMCTLRHTSCIHHRVSSTILKQNMDKKEQKSHATAVDTVSRPGSKPAWLPRSPPPHLASDFGDFADVLAVALVVDEEDDAEGVRRPAGDGERASL